MQVYVPLNVKTSYDETKPFAKAIAQLLEKQTPDKVVSKMKKVEREGKVFVDWSQNHRSKTTIAVYSTAGPRAADRLDPDHLGRGRERPRERRCLGPGLRDLATCSSGSSRHGDLFAPVLELQQNLPEL